MLAIESSPSAVDRYVQVSNRWTLGTATPDDHGSGRREEPRPDVARTSLLLKVRIASRTRSLVIVDLAHTQPFN